MSINLKDIPDAVKFYLDNKVNVVVNPPVPAGGTKISPNEAFTFSVKATNATKAAGGVDLKNVLYRVRVGDPAIATFTVPSAASGTARDDSGNTLAPNTPVSFMVFTPTGDLNKLLAGESDTLNLHARAGLGGNGGTTQLGARIVADIDLDSLFLTREDPPGNKIDLTVEPLINQP